MSREIKVRIVYKKYPNIWFKDEYTLRDLIEMDGAGFLGDDDIIEQYTGLEDKNGKEIYEGDICRLTYYTKRKPNKRWRKEHEDVEKVEFEDGYFRFATTGQYGIGSELSFSDYGEWSTADENYKYEAEVIGNIHESKELLEGEE